MDARLCIEYYILVGQATYSRVYTVSYDAGPRRGAGGRDYLIPGLAGTHLLATVGTVLSTV